MLCSGGKSSVVCVNGEIAGLYVRFPSTLFCLAELHAGGVSSRDGTNTPNPSPLEVPVPSD